MDLLFREGPVSALQIQQGLPDAPSYSAVRGLMRVLIGKGHVKFEEQGPRHVYSPAVAKSKAGKSAVSHLVETFFRGSVSETVAALLDSQAASLSDEELERIQGMIENARREGR